MREGYVGTEAVALVEQIRAAIARNQWSDEQLAALRSAIDRLFTDAA